MKPRVATNLQAGPPPASKTTYALSTPPLILVGASTGGPGALKSLLLQIPNQFWGSIIIVQRLDSQFLNGFVDWIAEATGKQVKVPESGQMPEPGVVYIAGAHGNLQLNQRGCFEYAPCNPKQHYCPSIDVLFDSVANASFAPSIACLLTGMGSDGALGLAALAKRGWRTYVQTPLSCAVDGMPMAALKIHPAHNSSSIEQMSNQIRVSTINFMRGTYANQK
jgi:two-component system response regulator WspF